MWNICGLCAYMMYLIIWTDILHQMAIEAFICHPISNHGYFALLVVKTSAQYQVCLKDACIVWHQSTSPLVRKGELVEEGGVVSHSWQYCFSHEINTFLSSIIEQTELRSGDRNSLIKEVWQTFCLLENGSQKLLIERPNSGIISLILFKILVLRTLCKKNYIWHKDRCNEERHSIDSWYAKKAKIDLQKI